MWYRFRNILKYENIHRNKWHKHAVFRNGSPGFLKNISELHFGCWLLCVLLLMLTSEFRQRQSMTDCVLLYASMLLMHWQGVCRIIVMLKNEAVANQTFSICTAWLIKIWQNFSAFIMPWQRLHCVSQMVADAYSCLLISSIHTGHTYWFKPICMEPDVSLRCLVGLFFRSDTSFLTSTSPVSSHVLRTHCTLCQVVKQFG